MNFRMISEHDVEVIREARKILTKIVKKEIRLNAAENDARDDLNKETWPAAKAHWRMLDELDALKLVESLGTKEKPKIKIRLTPSGKYANEIAF